MITSTHISTPWFLEPSFWLIVTKAPTIPSTNKSSAKKMIDASADLSEESHKTSLKQDLLQLGQIHFENWTNKFCNLDKYILQFGRIHLTIWTNIKNVSIIIFPPIQLGWDSLWVLVSPPLKRLFNIKWVSDVKKCQVYWASNSRKGEVPGS